ncbi:MAG: DUF6285 domain-containing protein [Acidobacteriota bacterium]
MRDLPTGPQLEALAREWEAFDLDCIQADERGAVTAMIERCHAIARREAAAGEAAMGPVRGALALLYPEVGDPAESLARLAHEIRSGGLDARNDRRRRAVAALTALTLQKLRESNPRFLAAHGIDPNGTRS